MYRIYKPIQWELVQKIHFFRSHVPVTSRPVWHCNIPVKCPRPPYPSHVTQVSRLSITWAFTTTYIKRNTKQGMENVTSMIHVSYERWNTQKVIEMVFWTLVTLMWLFYGLHLLKIQFTICSAKKKEANNKRTYC